MSHFMKIATKIVSAKHLVMALNDLGFKNVEVHVKPERLDGWAGDEAKMANVIVRKKYLKSTLCDIGFLQNAQGTFDALITDFDRDQHGYDDAWLQKLTQPHAYHVSRDLHAPQNFSLVEEKTDKDGTIRLTVRRMA